MLCFENYVTVFIYLSYSCVSAIDLKVAFWVDLIQKDINDDIELAIKKFGELKLGINIIDYTVVIDSVDFNGEEQSQNTLCQIISSEGIAVVIDFTYQRWQTGINLLNNHGIRLIRVERIISPFLKIFSEFLQRKASNDVVLIFQNEQDEIEGIYEMIDGLPFRALVANAFNEKNFIKRLLDIRPIPTYFAVFSNSFEMNNIFEKIHKGNLFNRPEEWHFVFLDADDGVFKYRTQAENATKFVLDANSVCQSMHMEKSYCLRDFTFRRAMILNILRSLSLYIEAIPSSLPTIRGSCEDISTGNRRTDFLEQMEYFDFITLVENDPYQEEETSQPRLSYAVNMSISTYASEEINETQLAKWQSGQLHKINETISPSKRFFRIGITEAIPWTYKLRDEKTNEVKRDDKGKIIWVGFCIDLIYALAEKGNFNYELIEPKKGTFGERDYTTGLWDGIVGDLITGEIDFTVTALKMYSEREEYIDFIAPYFGTTGITIVMRKPIKQSSLFKFMTVLRLEVWLSIIGALVATAVMLWFLDKYSPYSSRNRPEDYPFPCREFTLRESFWFALTSFTPQGGGEAPKAVSGRILVGAYWLFVVLMLATFTANLAAFLTVERMQTPVQNLEQLARQSRINYTVVSESDAHQYFINMKFAEDTLYRMWKELALNESRDFHKFRVWDYPIKEQYGHILISINSSEPVSNASEGFRKVNEAVNADFAFIHDSSEIKFEITRNCNLTEIGEIFAEQPYAMAVQQGSHLLDEFSYSLLELQKVRFLEELKAKHWNVSRIKQCSASEEEEGITLESLGGVFIATLFGLGLALITLVFEVFFYKRQNGDLRVKGPTKITQVQPAELESDQKQTNVKKSWGLGKKMDISTITPPPSFETATFFRGRKVPPSITLGGEEFKPRYRGASETTQNYAGYTYGGFREKDKSLPPYME